MNNLLEKIKPKMLPLDLSDYDITGFFVKDFTVAQVEENLLYAKNHPDKLVGIKNTAGQICDKDGKPVFTEHELRDAGSDFFNYLNEQIYKAKKEDDKTVLGKSKKTK